MRLEQAKERTAMFNYSQHDPAECEFIEVAESNEIPNGERLFFEIDQEQIVIFRIGGSLFAISDVCSHDDGPLGDGELDEHEISCPRHGARFDVRSGKALTLPAYVDIPAYPLREEDGKIYLGLPLQR